MRFYALVGAIFFVAGSILFALTFYQTFIPSSTDRTAILDSTMIVSAILIILGAWLYLREPKDH
jgi:high-affinity Fe2+/Pb2+ permease